MRSRIPVEVSICMYLRDINNNSKKEGDSQAGRTHREHALPLEFLLIKSHIQRCWVASFNHVPWDWQLGSLSQPCPLRLATASPATTYNMLPPAAHDRYLFVEAFRRRYFSRTRRPSIQHSVPVVAEPLGGSRPPVLCPHLLHDNFSLRFFSSRERRTCPRASGEPGWDVFFMSRASTPLSNCRLFYVAPMQTLLVEHDPKPAHTTTAR